MIWYGWVGLGVLLASQALLPLQITLHSQWFTPVMWTAYVLLADALVLRRAGASLLHDRPREAAFMATVSIPLWLVFEVYNWRLQNWDYFGLPEPLWLAAIGYAWAFATIWPGLFETAALFQSGGESRLSYRPDASGLRLIGRPSAFGGRPAPPEVPPWTPPPGGGTRTPSPRGRPPLSASLRMAVLVGLIFVTIPPVLPAAVRPWTFGFVWLGFILLLDPLNYRAGRPSFTAAWRRGDRRLVYGWLLAGLVCGLLWEFWNYWAAGKWKYVGVPVLPELKLFEMPVVGYLGFPPFALEAFAMYHFVRPLAFREEPLVPSTSGRETRRWPASVASGRDRRR
jgi:hypothetical protein